jgi:hypothetical protein
MTHPIRKEIRFSEHRRLDTPAPHTGEVRDALKVIFFVTASLAVGYGIFYELLMLCIALDISVWWGTGIFVGLYGVALWKECRCAIPLAVLISAAPAHADDGSIGGFIASLGQPTSTSPDNISQDDDDDDE